MVDGPERRAPITSAAGVVITTYNHAHFLGDAIESVLAQARAPAEILVVDDGSTDDPGSVVARYPGVRLIRQANQGLAAARNTGLAQSTPTPGPSAPRTEQGQDAQGRQVVIYDPLTTRPDRSRVRVCLWRLSPCLRERAAAQRELLQSDQRRALPRLSQGQSHRHARRGHVRSRETDRNRRLRPDTETMRRLRCVSAHESIHAGRVPPRNRCGVSLARSQHLGQPS